MPNSWEDKKILVVDDASLIRESLTKVYTELGLEVVGQAHQGVEALRLVAELQPDIVSLDIIMAEMDGIECFRKLVAQKSGVRCLFVSSLATEPRVIQSYIKEIPAQCFVPKPFTRAGLESALDYIMRHGPLAQVNAPDAAGTQAAN